MTDTWDKLPLNLMDEFAERETYNRYHYRPVYSLHKWWARRPGSTFRMLGLATLTDDTVSKDDILRETDNGKFEGLYLQNQGDKFEDSVVLDPFTGGGTTLVEMNRLGAQTIGYELNPVAWWSVKKTIENVDKNELERGFETILEETRDELDEYYTTKDPDTGKDCEVLHFFQSQEIPCLTCDENVRLSAKQTLVQKKKTAPAYVYCPNLECEDPINAYDHEIGDTETCQQCGNEFDPGDGNYGYGKYTCSNGHKHDVKETLQRQEKKPEFQYVAIQYITPRGEKKIKTPDEDDLEKVHDVENEYQSIKDSLPVPSQRIPDGDKTQALLNYNYERFEELFSTRQKLTFGTLLNLAQNHENDDVGEYAITAISNSLEYNSKLCKWYTRTGGYVGNVFSRHAFIPRVQPVEANPLNNQDNVAALEGFFDRVLRVKTYCDQPFEKFKNRQTGEVYDLAIQNENISENRLESLKCKTSESIKKDDESVDYVITDPPYYDNVQYSELSDYFYVWLREGLKEEYSEFSPKLVPKTREIVANNEANKDEEFFIEALTNVFSECNRVLKQDGEMVFTYHHNENEAWSVILEAIIESGFTVAGAYPVQSEMPNNPHISDLDNAEYDILIFANKDKATEDTTLTQLRQDLFFEIQEMIEEERKRHKDLSQADLGVILRGKCMYYYSKHYPNVYSDGAKVEIDEALNTVDSVIEQVIEGSVNLPQEIDALTQAYAAFCQRGQEQFDDLNKHLLAKNLNVGDLEDEKLVKGSREKKEPVTADERIIHIKGKLNKNGKDGDEILDIDKVQYLFHLYKTDQNTVEYLKEWKTDDLEELAAFMAEVTGDDRYENVMNMGISQF